jgi:gliding motility-associated-like protein
LYSHSYLNFSSPSAKTITIKYVVYSGTTCVNETTNIITLLASPHVVFYTIPSVCDNNNSFQITEATETSSANGQYTFSGTGVKSSGIFNPTISGTGTFSILYSFTSNNGCIDTASQTITVWPHPSVNAGSEILILDGDSSIINATAIGNQLSYLWQPNIYLNKDTLLNPVITPHQNTWYTITATDIHSCSNSDSLFVKVLMMPKVPNVFSPNGDGINDKWEIKYLSDYPECSVRVFTRTGQLVFESIGYATAWGGTLNGQALPIGTYYYIIQPHRGRGTISGSVTIIR